MFDDVPDYEGKVDGGGLKDSQLDKSKIPVQLVPPSLVNASGRALAHGIEKYARHNWMRGMDYSEIIGGLKRHISNFENQEVCDEDSGLAALDHIAACLTFLLYYEEHPSKYKKFDDRVFEVAENG
jgi:hypothetical protein